MVVLNYTGGEVNAKIVYYGPGLSGKTTNLEYIHEKTPAGSRGKMVSMKTQTDRTLFFDFLPLELGEINGYRTRFLLYTVPGQVYYNATRKLVLKGVDAVVFVADSSRAKLDENLESLRNLEQNLNEHGLSLDELPWVIQYNKRDASDAMTVRDLDGRLNPLRVPHFEATATAGQGVYETFHGIATLVYRVLKDRLERGDLAAEPAPGAEAPRAPVAARPPAPGPAGRSAPAPAPEAGEFEFDTAIDSALREVEAPARAERPRAAAPNPSARPAPHRAGEPPVPAGARAEGVRPGAPGPSAGPPRPAGKTPPEVPRRGPAEPAAGAGRAPATPHAVDPSRADDGLFESIPSGAFDLELGRLPALDDASVASDQARDEGPHEFVTDPMRRPLGTDTPRPAPAAPPARPTPAPLPVRAEETPPLIEHDEAPTAAAVLSVTVPVVLTRAQIGSGGPVRLVLDIRIKD